MRNSPPQTDLRRLWGRSIRQRRLELGLTQDQTAAAVGVALKAYQRFESGHHNPTLDTIGRVAAVLQRSPGSFLADSWAPAARSERPNLPSGWRYVSARGAGIAVFGVQAQAGAEAPEQEVLELGRAQPPRGRRLTSAGLFVLQARGDSMQPQIQPNDWLLLRSGVQQPWLGKIVLVQAMAPGEAAVGRWWIKKLTALEQLTSGATRLRLESTAPGHPALWREGWSDEDLGLLAELVEVLGPGAA